MLTPETIRRTECLGDPYAMQSCSDIDRKEAAEELYEAVREAVDQSVVVYRDPNTWYVFADGWRVRSVEEAVEVTGGNQ